jgi:flagellar hook assembly protein FlgD
MAFSVSGSFTEDQIKRLNAISNDAANESRKKSQVLDKDAFLKLMMMQLQNQNPLSPTDNSEYMNQMAQFSSVEQLTNISTSQERNNQLNALISTQLEEMTALLGKLADHPQGQTGSSELVESQKTVIQQNAKILEELVKLNTMFSSYLMAPSTVTDEDVFSVLGN